jgi:hypothetical protein
LVRRTRIPQNVESAIVALAVEQPTLGRIHAAAEINNHGFAATPSTVRSLWRRHGLQTAAKRISAFSIQGSLVDETPHPMLRGPIVVHDHMADAFVFSVAALTFVGLDHPEPDGLSVTEPTLWSPSTFAVFTDRQRRSSIDYAMRCAFPICLDPPSQ